MFKRVYCLVIVLIAYLFSFSQNHQNVLVDRVTKKPIQFATIKVLKKPHGAITTERGTFSLSMYNTDSIYISSLGYCDTIIVLNKTSDTILLTPKFNQLENITVNSQKVEKKIVLGNGTNFTSKKNICKPSNNKIACYYWVSGGGAEFAEIIQLPEYNKSYHIDAVSIPVKKINCWEPFMIKLYTVNDKELKPDSLFFQKTISLTDITKNKNGIIKISLKEEKLVIQNTNSIAMSFSWIEPNDNTNCGTGLLLQRGTKGICLSRSIFSPDYNWAIFNGNKKAEDNTTGSYRTMFLMELSVK